MPVIRGRWLHGQLAVLALGVLSGCEPSTAAKYRLEGSLIQVMELGFDEVRVNLAPEDLSLQFVRLRPIAAMFPLDGGEPTEASTAEEYPFQLGYRFAGPDLPGVGRYDLAELDPMTGRQRGTVSRNVKDDPRTEFPPLARGTVAFKEPLTAGATVHGDFHVTFLNGAEAASGRTAFVTSFTAKVSTP